MLILACMLSLAIVVFAFSEMNHEKRKEKTTPYLQLLKFLAITGFLVVWISGFFLFVQGTEFWKLLVLMMSSIIIAAVVGFVASVLRVLDINE